MWYHYSLIVPALTEEKSPVERELKLTYGVITYIGVGFPNGCKQLVKAKAYHQEHQIFPNNPDEWASWDGGIEGGQQHYQLYDEPFKLKGKAYSLDDTLPHTITFFINILPPEVAEPWTVQTSILDKLKNLFGIS